MSLPEGKQQGPVPSIKSGNGKIPVIPERPARPTKVYRAKKPEVKPEVKQETKKPEVKPEVKQETKKPETKPEVKQEVKDDEVSEVVKRNLEKLLEADKVSTSNDIFSDLVD